MRFLWTSLMTLGYMLVAVAQPNIAVVLVPAYCLAVAVPYGAAFCERRWRRWWRDHHDHPWGHGHG